MSNSPVVTAFRDALRKNQIGGVNKETYISQINQSSLTKTQQELDIIELELVSCEFSEELYSEEDLTLIQKKLQALKKDTTRDNKSPVKNTKWGTMNIAHQKSNQLFASLPLQQNSNEIKRENLLQKVENILKKMRDEQIKKNNTLFMQILNTVSNKSFINLTEFMRNLITLRQLCTNKSGGEGGSEDWVKLLKKNFQSLSDNDLKKTYARMHSDEMIALINVFFTQRYIQMNEDGLSDVAFQDALSIWPMNMGWMKANIIHSAEGIKKALSMQPDAYAKRAFTSAAAQFYTMVVNVYDSLCEVMESKRLRGYVPVLMSEINENKPLNEHTIYLRAESGQLSYRTKLSEKIFTITKKDYEDFGFRADTSREFFLAIDRISKEPSSLGHNIHHYLENVILKITAQRGHTIPLENPPYLSEWPIDKEKKPLPIIISDVEKHLIGECVKAHDPINLANRKPLQKMKSKPYFSQEKFEAYYFGKMIHSLGCFFNPKQFCDLLLITDSTEIHNAIKTASKAELKFLYRQLRGGELNNLVALLKCIKEGDAEKRKEVYQWLSIKNPGMLDERFQTVAGELYDNADKLMQLVREQLEIKKDYAYNNLQLKPSRVYSRKNSACLKRLLEVYVGASPKKDFSYGIWDYLYSFIHQGATLEENLDKEDDEPLLLKLVKGARTEPCTPTSTPSNTPKHDSSRRIDNYGEYSPV